MLDSDTNGQRCPGPMALCLESNETRFCQGPRREPRPGSDTFSFSSARAPWDRVRASAPANYNSRPQREIFYRRHELAAKIARQLQANLNTVLPGWLLLL